jgi:hypothetical protein
MPKKKVTRRVTKKKVTKKKTTRSRARVLSVSKRQTGRSNKRIDKKRTALPPGRRVSRRGKKYTETRANRSDRSARLRL